MTSRKKTKRVVKPAKETSGTKTHVRLKKSSRREAPTITETTGQWFEKLAAVMARLRATGGCPWDREQTHASLRTYLIEEAYEVLEALDARDDEKFPDELGDLLLQVLFHSQIASEESRFTIVDVIRQIHDKMIRRHPHVFGEIHAKDSAEVLRNWEIIKAEERRKKGTAATEKPPESILDGVPRSLPALLQGYQLTRKAARVGFDWHNIDGIFDKLVEETNELREALKEKRADEIEGELGDILFVAVNLARFLKLDPEIAMHKANNKFTNRFHEMEGIARERRTTFAKIPRPEMESLWEAAKRRKATAAKSRV
jgi:tetrapyrrole methylase family protein/MazG family protein